MTNAISNENIIGNLKNGKKAITNLLVMAYGETLNQAGEKAFSDAIEIGIKNTFAALYDANVSDEEILRVVYEHWGITKPEAEDRLIYEKQQAPIRNLKQYMKLQGYTKREIDVFIQENKVFIKVRHDKELWKLKDAPDKLFKAVQSRK